MLGLLPVHGTFDLSDGRVTIAADPARCAASATIAAESWVSGNSVRDAHVASAALLDAKTYPEITLCTSPSTRPASRSESRPELPGRNRATSSAAMASTPMPTRDACAMPCT